MQGQGRKYYLNKFFTCANCSHLWALKENPTLYWNLINTFICVLNTTLNKLYEALWETVESMIWMPNCQSRHVFVFYILKKYRTFPQAVVVDIGYANILYNEYCNSNINIDRNLVLLMSVCLSVFQNWAKCHLLFYYLKLLFLLLPSPYI